MHRGIFETRTIYSYNRAKHKTFLLQKMHNLIERYTALPYGMWVGNAFISSKPDKQYDVTQLAEFHFCYTN